MMFNKKELDAILAVQKLAIQNKKQELTLADKTRAKEMLLKMLAEVASTEVVKTVTGRSLQS